MGQETELGDARRGPAAASSGLHPLEPDHGLEFVARPFSLLPNELGQLPVTMAKVSTPVLAWVRYPAISVRVSGLALAWTPRAVYVEWEDSGTHRVWVWASAVERAPVTQESTPTPKAPRSSVLTAASTEPLVHLVNVQLDLVGAEFMTAMVKPTGPFSAGVFGKIDGHHVRLDFFTEPETDMCTVLLASRDKELPNQSAAPTFEEAIEAYPWGAAVDALALD